MADYYSKKALCPFWCKTSAEQNKIFCREGVNDSTRLQLWFKGDEGKRKAYLAKHCCMHYAMCPVYKIIAQQYGE